MEMFSGMYGHFSVPSMDFLSEFPGKKQFSKNFQIFLIEFLLKDYLSMLGVKTIRSTIKWLSDSAIVERRKSFSVVF